MSRFVLLFLAIFMLWFFPGYYLATHEAGHCISAAQMGSSQQHLYLGCAGSSDKKLFDFAVTDSSSVKICSPFFYSFFAQKGFCYQEYPKDKMPILTRNESVWIGVSGSIYGFVASYLLALFLYSLYLFRKNKKTSSKDFFLSPFHIYSMVTKIQGDSLGKKILLWGVCFGYMLHVERLFYGFVPSSIVPFMPPLSQFLFGDGNNVWAHFIDDYGTLQSFAWGFWFFSLFLYFLLIRKAWAHHKKICASHQP